MGLRSAVAKFFGDTFGGDSFLWNSVGGSGGRNKKQLLGEYRNLVYSCVSTIAEDVGQYEPIFSYETKDGDRIIEHPFKVLLENPNPSMTQYDLFENTQSFIELTGEAFWYLEVKEQSRLPVAIHTVDPHRVSIEIDQRTGQILYYNVLNFGGTQVRCELDEMIHFKMFNPLNPYRGLGTVEAGLLYIDTENEASSFQKNFLANHATPSGVLSIGGNISKDGFDKVKKQFKQQHQGPRNAGKILFTKADQVAFTKIGASLAELDMSALKKTSQDEVRSMFRMPKAMLGGSDESGLGRANVEAIEYSYSKRTIDPKLTRIDDTLRLYCRRAYKDPKLQIGHVSQIPADREALRAQAKELTYTVMTQNESRGLYELPPIQGGDTLYAPFNISPIGQEIVALAKSYGKLKIKAPLQLAAPIEKSKQTQQGFLKELNAIHTIAEKAYDSGLSRELEKQKKVVLARFHNRAKALEEDDIDGIGPDGGDDIAAFMAAITPVLINAMESGGSSAVTFVSPDGEYILDKALRDRILKAEEKLLNGYNVETAKSITRQLGVGLAKGETTAELAARIETVYSEATGYRAQRIATTEANRAIVGATSDAYEQVGVSQVEWITDGNPCPECEALEGTIIDIGGSFAQNDYGDVEGGDLHPNCNCKLVPVVDGSKSLKQIVYVPQFDDTENQRLLAALAEQEEYTSRLEEIVGLDGPIEEN